MYFLPSHLLLFSKLCSLLMYMCSMRFSAACSSLAFKLSSSKIEESNFSLTFRHFVDHCFVFISSKHIIEPSP